MTLIIIQAGGHDDDGITHPVCMIAEGIAHDPGDLQAPDGMLDGDAVPGELGVRCLLVSEERPAPRLFSAA